LSTLYLCGVGNGEGVRLALQVNRATARWQRILLLDDDASKHGTERLGLAVAGGFDRLAGADRSTDEVVNLVTRTTMGRVNARGKIAAYGVSFASLVHPGVDLLGTRLDDEVTVYANTSIGAEASVGRSSVILVGAVVGHGARVGQSCVIAPNAVINGRVILEDRVYVGSNASILPDLRIGAGATIAANSLVVSDVPAGTTALGVPATIMQAETTSDRSAVVGFGRDEGLNGGDRHQLTSPQSGQQADLELVINGVMREVLTLIEVPRSSNFFDLGGTSLKAVQLCQQLNDRCGLPVRPLDVYKFPSVAALSTHLAGRNQDAAVPEAERRGAQRRSLMGMTKNAAVAAAEL
jgi:serine acetyltransferase/acyl carrier protein